MAPFEHLGPYRIVEPLGRGGMGSVFKAVHVTTGEEVAVKVIAASVSDDMRFRRRFDDEIKTLIKLKHPNIVSIIGCGEQHGQLFYSMELVEGETLQQLLRREKRLPWPFVLDMAIDICNALKHAHNFGVTHRDLKPANLLIREDGTPKLVDFGIAKLFGSSEQTAAGSVLGTADFMAPEQAGDGAISPRTDLYALGNVLYACFAGRPPFAGRTVARVIESLQREAPTPLDLIAPEVPEEIILLVHDLLEKRPEARPPTALAVMNRMKAIRAGLHRQATSLDMGKTVIQPLAVDEKVLPSESESPTQVQPTSSNETPTIVAEDVVIRVVVPPQNDATVPESLSQANPRTPSTHRDEDYEAPKTHFSTIQEHERRRGLWEQEQQEHPSNHWVQWLSIAAMVAMLIGALGLFIWSTRRPSADELYQTMVGARERDDLISLRSQLDFFKRLYPDDPRAAELEPYLAEVDSTRILRRLRLAMVREGGDDYLSPYEQSFVEAMRVAERDPRKAKQMLQHWLDVYDPGTGDGEQTYAEADRQLRAIAIAARQEVHRLSSFKQPSIDSRAADLIRRIDWAAETLSGVEYRKLLEGTISLYQSKDWATPAIEVAQKRLQEIDATSTPEPE
jgi:serine/threonine protein kinase